MHTDDEIIAAVKDSNTKNFEFIIERYNNRILNFIHKMIFSYEDAQNLTQDVFIKVFENLHRYQSQQNFQSFIFTIAKNLTLNFIKKNRRMVPFSQILSGRDKEISFGSEDTQHIDLERTEQQIQLDAALKQIKENYRLALIMKVYLGFSYKQIADITGWSIPKIETLISRAKGELKKRISLMSQEKENKNVV